MSNRNELIKKLYLGENPWENFQFNQSEVSEFALWNSDNKLLRKGIELVRPKTILEVGVWMGGSVIHMADILRETQIDAQIVAADTFLGCEILRAAGYTLPMMKMEFGRPTYWRTFYQNVMKNGHECRVLPLHMDSRSAFRHFIRQGLKVDMIHHDATHHHPDVYHDLVLCWKILNPGGVLVIDDYVKSALKYPEFCDFNGLVCDVDRFCYENMVDLEVDGAKCLIEKPS